MKLCSAAMFGIIFAAASVASEPELHVSPGTTHGAVGICILLDRSGHVTEAHVVTSSGDQILDQSVTDYFLTLQWNKPYPPPGWQGLIFEMGQGNSKSATPECSKFKRAKTTS